MPRHRMETLLHEWKRGGVGVLFLTLHYARRVHVREILRQCCLAPYSLDQSSREVWGCSQELLRADGGLRKRLVQASYFSCQRNEAERLASRLQIQAGGEGILYSVYREPALSLSLLASGELMMGRVVGLANLATHSGQRHTCLVRYWETV